jgi:predicted NBD/HSP70 family sugar kinase
VDGKVLNGRHGIAGEWGQIVMNPNGPVSNFGTRGTIESLIAGPALERFYRERSGTARSLKEIAGRVESDADAVATVDHLIDTLAKGLAIIIDVLDPDAVVFGGGVGNLDVLYTARLTEKLAPLVFTDRLDTAILRPRLGDSAGVFGAAAFGSAL